MRETNMPLSEIKSYGELYLQGDETFHNRREILVNHHNLIKKNLKNLQEIDLFLENKIKHLDQKKTQNT